MKIRTDFVTNSSSSSFITLSLKNKKIVDELKKCGADIKVNIYGYQTSPISGDDEIYFSTSELEKGLFASAMFLPKTVEELIELLLEWIEIDGKFLPEEFKSEIMNHIDDYKKETQSIHLYGENKDTEGGETYGFDISYDGKEITEKIRYEGEEEYEFECPNCGESFTLELTEDEAEDDVECPYCGEMFNSDDMLDDEDAGAETDNSIIKQYALEEKTCFLETDIMKVYLKNDRCTVVVFKQGISEIPSDLFEVLPRVHDASVIIPNSVKKICPEAFESFYYTNDWAEDWIIHLTDSIEYYGKRSFAETNAYFNGLDFKNAIIIEEEAFLETINLGAKIVFGNHLKSIGERAFYRCKKLKNVTIPNSKTVIEKDAFAGCSKLTIIAPRGSLAEEYAMLNKITFKAL